MTYPQVACQPACNLNNLITSWSVTASMGGPYTASLQIVDPCNLFTCNSLDENILLPVNITLDSFVVGGDSFDLICQTRNVRWVWGILTNVSKAFEDGNRTFDLSVESFTARLSKKVINSHHTNQSARLVLSELCSIYANLPSGYYDFSQTQEIPINSPVTGNSLTEQMHLIAQVGKSDLFVDEHGLLTTRAWFDPSEPSELTITKQYVISAERPQVDFAVPSRITARGSYYSGLSKGNQDLGGGGGGGGGGNPPNRQRQIYCAHNPFEDSEFNFLFNNLSGSRADIRNATILTDDGRIVDGVIREGLTPGQLSFRINGPNGDYLGAGQHEVAMRAVGRMRYPQEVQPHERGRGILGTGIFDPNEYIKMLNYVLTTYYPGMTLTSRSSGAGGSGGRRENDAPELLRYEVILDDPDLVEQVGVITEELENHYIKHREHLYDLAVHRFQEAKMNRQQWDISLVYYPCISLGQRITVQLPDTVESGECSVTGRVVQIKTDYSPEPKVNTNITLLPDDSIGSTEYYTGNIMDDPDLLGYGESWNYEETGDASVFIYGGVATVACGPGGNGELTYAQGGMTVGREYDIKFTLVAEEGADLQFRIMGAGSILDTLISDEGERVFHFTANDDALEFIWTASGTVKTWKISKPSIHAYITG